MRSTIKVNLENQDNKIIKCTNNKLLPVKVNSTLRIPIPDINKGRWDARNILEIILKDKYTSINLIFILKIIVKKKCILLNFVF